MSHVPANEYIPTVLSSPCISAFADYPMKPTRFSQQILPLAALAGLCLFVYWLWPIKFGLTRDLDLSDRNSYQLYDLQLQLESQPFSHDRFSLLILQLRMPANVFLNKYDLKNINSLDGIKFPLILTK
jgi:hypothetical protein